MTAVGALLRSVAARVAVVPYQETLVDWGPALHDRFSLPHLLAEDLRAVLADLADHGLRMPLPLAEAVLAPREPIAVVQQGAATLTLTPALEFWPLIGDVASQERSGARLVDASSARVEVLVEVPRGEPPGDLAVAGWEVPLLPLPDRGPSSRYVAGIRYRTFEPHLGLHPGLPAQDPLPLVWGRGDRAVAVELHGWIPGGGAYDGLPADAEEAI